ncbi:MAG TPA: DUF523 and DUF1722 domain-containing protein [Anaerolineae bacterium]|nr:DUF523 and DUF1722 domain-containing protein [Anaerolineae bacterium]
MKNRNFPRPNVIVSRCLGFDACRYNDVTIADDFVKQLAAHVTYLPVCPEVEIGLGAPRNPVRLVLRDDVVHLYQPATAADVTEAMQTFSATYLDAHPDVDGAILMGRSPSCGIKEVKIYAGMDKTASVRRKGAGMFAAAVHQRYAHLPVEENVRLQNLILREHFLTRLFAWADFRAVQVAGTMRELVRYHTENKLLLMVYNESRYRRMGPLVANHLKRPAAEVLAAYAEHLGVALAHPPRRTAGINGLMHALGYFSEKLSAAEKAYFLDTLDQYRRSQVSLQVPVNLIGAWIARFGEPYLAQQTFFAPYPPDLLSLSDSGKGRAVE